MRTLKDLLFLDTETHDLDQPRAVQVAWMDNDGRSTFEGLYNPGPGHRITWGAMAVHHITNEAIEGKDPFMHSEDWKRLDKLLVSQNKILVAHNAPFDLNVLKNEDIWCDVYIDTLRVAKHLYPDFSKHNLQYLRYRLGVDQPQFHEMQAHDALADVLVLHAVFEELYKVTASKLPSDASEDDVLAEMLKMTLTMPLMRVIPFGKHQGKEFSSMLYQRDVRSWCEWLMKQDKVSEEIRYTIEHWLNQTK